MHVPLSEVDEVRGAPPITERTKICRELEVWQTLHSGLVWGSINGQAKLRRVNPYCASCMEVSHPPATLHAVSRWKLQFDSALLDHSPRWPEEGDSMATSGFYYTPRPIITAHPRYFDVNRGQSCERAELFGGTQRIQVDCADYDGRANALRVHALLHFGGMIMIVHRARLRPHAAVLAARRRRVRRRRAAARRCAAAPSGAASAARYATWARRSRLHSSLPSPSPPTTPSPEANVADLDRMLQARAAIAAGGVSRRQRSTRYSVGSAPSPSPLLFASSLGSAVSRATSAVDGA